MRVSADRESPDYRSDYLGAAVYIDGELAAGVIAADDVAGEVLMAALTEDGQVYLGQGGKVATEVRRGVVQIVKHGSWSSARAIGFDAWMRIRTEAAHVRFMQRTRSLP
jgi:hypothetical protein